MEENKTLEQISIRKNCISNVGAISLGKALAVNQSLIKIYLQRNSIANEGCKAIILSLENNTTISAIYMHENSIYHDMKIYIKSKENRIKV